MGCELCPRHCPADRSKGPGFCGASDRMKVARVGIHRYEEPCLAGEGGSGAVFFSGCNLRCVFCQNKVLQTGKMGQYFSPEELAEAMLELQQLGADNIDLVTPTPHVAGICAAIDKARAQGLHLPIIYNTNAYLTTDTVQRLQGYIDLWLPDIKYRDQRLADAFSKAPNYYETAMAAVEAMMDISGQLQINEAGRAQRGVLIRHLVLPNCIYDTRAILDGIRERFSTDTCLSLMRQFTPQPDGQFPLNRKLTHREYNNAVDYCINLGFERVYIQKAASATFAYTPEFGDYVTVQL